MKIEHLLDCQCCKRIRPLVIDTINIWARAGRDIMIVDYVDLMIVFTHHSLSETLSNPAYFIFNKHYELLRDGWQIE